MTPAPRARRGELGPRVNRQAARVACRTRCQHGSRTGPFCLGKRCQGWGRTPSPRPASRDARCRSRALLLESSGNNQNPKAVNPGRGGRSNSEASGPGEPDGWKPTPRPWRLADQPHGLGRHSCPAGLVGTASPTACLCAPRGGRRPVRLRVCNAEIAVIAVGSYPDGGSCWCPSVNSPRKGEGDGQYDGQVNACRVPRDGQSQVSEHGQRRTAPADAGWPGWPRTKNTLEDNSPS